MTDLRFVNMERMSGNGVKRGRVAVPGFYAGVKSLGQFERKQFTRLPFTPAYWRKLTGAPRLFGEKGFNSLKARSAASAWSHSSSMRTR